MKIPREPLLMVIKANITLLTHVFIEITADDRWQMPVMPV
jgi:hypothetical protein